MAFLRSPFSSDPPPILRDDRVTLRSPEMGDFDQWAALRFESREAAEDYAREKGIDYTLVEPHSRKPNVRARGYGENFATDRRAPWTH